MHMLLAITTHLSLNAGLDPSITGISFCGWRLIHESACSFLSLKASAFSRCISITRILVQRDSGTMLYLDLFPDELKHTPPEPAFLILWVQLSFARILGCGYTPLGRASHAYSNKESTHSVLR